MTPHRIPDSLRPGPAAALALCAVVALAPAPARAAGGRFTLEQVLSYPFATGITVAERGNAVAWVRVVKGVRNVWRAEAPGFAPRQVTRYADDDGQEITHLAFSPDGKHLVYVRGGDHHANWEARTNPAPGPASSPDQPKVETWAVPPGGAAPVRVAEGDAPALSSRGQLAYVRDNQVWTAPLDGKGKPARLFFDRGAVGELHWSPDGSRLAFVSNRDGDHAFIGVFAPEGQTVTYLAPSTGQDLSPRWSPDGKEIAFVRLPGEGGPPRPLLTQTPRPFSIWVADAATGAGRRVWQSPETLLGSFPETAGNVNLHWAAGGRLVFLADLDGWPHLYSIPAGGGEPLLLTPGPFMVEHVAQTRDRRFLVYDANAGTAEGDHDRRHLFRVPADAAAPEALTSGEGLEWSPVVPDDAHVAFLDAGAKRPMSVSVIGTDGKDRRDLGAGPVPAEFPADALVVPKPVHFKAADGWTVHGQLFEKDDGKAGKPGVIFVHGGPPRQMLLGWHYMDYYSNAYAVNQYLADRGFVVLSVNYRLGIGYGHAFHHPEHAGPAGAAEYQDVLAGARFLQRHRGVDPRRLGVWGGSYGGYLTALALARDSDTFKAGVDIHGVHDWSRSVAADLGGPETRYEKGDREQALKVAWESSPDADVGRWKSPVLFIHGDDDRNVHFAQTIDLARRLQAHHVPFAEMVIPNETHDFMRYHSWLAADRAAAQFLAEHLGNP